MEAPAGGMTNLVSILSEQFPNANLVSVKRKYFNEESGLASFRKLCVPEFLSLEIEILNKFDESRCFLQASLSCCCNPSDN
jgi:DNA mismatch repair protein MSH4